MRLDIGDAVSDASYSENNAGGQNLPLQYNVHWSSVNIPIRILNAPLYGCTDSTAITVVETEDVSERDLLQYAASNYDPNAVLDDGLCEYPGCAISGTIYASDVDANIQILLIIFVMCFQVHIHVVVRNFYLMVN